ALRAAHGRGRARDADRGLGPGGGALAGLGAERGVTPCRGLGRVLRVKPQVYKDPRPAEHFTRFHVRARKAAPDPMYELVRLLLTPVLLLFYRTRCIGSDNVPAEGPAVIGPNHC